MLLYIFGVEQKTPLRHKRLTFLMVQNSSFEEVAKTVIFFLMFIIRNIFNIKTLIIYDALDTLLYTLRRPYFRKLENQDALVCISESIPEPTVEWVFCDSQSDRYDMWRENCFYDFTFSVSF